MAQVESEWRHRKLSDEKIKYFSRLTDHTIHDKTCKLLRTIPDGELFCLTEYDDKKNQCSECMVKAYLRLGSKDFEAISAYEKLFNQMKVSREQLRELYVTCRMKTRVSGDCLLIWHKDDKWQIISLDKDGFVQLRHNNYRKLPDGGRKFVPGFHIQNDKCAKARFKYVLSVIKGYDFENHKVQKSVDEAVPEAKKECKRSGAEFKACVKEEHRPQAGLTAKKLIHEPVAVIKVYQG